MKCIFLIVFVVLLLAGCGSNTGSKPNFKEHKQIVFKQIDCDDIIGFSLQILKVDSLLLLNDWREDSIIRIFNLNTNRFLYNLAAIGEGPNELSNPTLLQIEGNKLYLNETRRFKLYSISLDSLEFKTQTMKMHFKVPSETQRVYALSDSFFVSTGIFESRYVLMNQEGKKLNEFGEYPNFWKQELDFPISAKAMFHQAQFIKHPSQTIFSFVSSHVLSVYAYDPNKADKPWLEEEILLNDYNYKFTSGSYISAQRGDDVERGVTAVANSSEHIYVVFNMGTKASPDLGCKIMVFDWEGNPVRVYNTANELKSIVVDEQEKRAYCVIQDPEDKIVYFDL